MIIIILGMMFSMWPGPSDVEAASGEELYKFYCAQCHGLGGKGDGPNVTRDMPVTPRDFTNSAEMSKLSDADMKNVILDGGPVLSKSPLMPAWSGTLKKAEVEKLIEYLRTLCQCSGR